MSSTMCRRWAGSGRSAARRAAARSGSCASAWASLTRWRMPFEKPAEPAFGDVVEADVCSARCAAASGSATPRSRASSRHSAKRGEERPEPVAVGHHADAAVHVGVAARVGAQDAHAAPVGRREARAAACSAGRLAGAVVPEQARHAGPQRERHVGHRDRVAVPLRDALEPTRARRSLLGPPVAHHSTSTDTPQTSEVRRQPGPERHAAGVRVLPRRGTCLRERPPGSRGSASSRAVVRRAEPRQHRAGGARGHEQRRRSRPSRTPAASVSDEMASPSSAK